MERSPRLSNGPLSQLFKEIEKKTKLLKESTEELRKEVIQKRLEIKNLREDVVSKQKQLMKEQKELEELMDYQVGLKVCCAHSVNIETLHPCGYNTQGWRGSYPT